MEYTIEYTIKTIIIMIIRIIISNPSWLGLVSVLAGAPTDSLAPPYPTLRPTLIDTHPTPIRSVDIAITNT